MDRLPGCAASLAVALFATNAAIADNGDAREACYLLATYDAGTPASRETWDFIFDRFLDFLDIPLDDFRSTNMYIRGDGKFSVEVAADCERGKTYITRHMSHLADLADDDAVADQIRHLNETWTSIARDEFETVRLGGVR